MTQHLKQGQFGVDVVHLATGKRRFTQMGLVEASNLREAFIGYTDMAPPASGTCGYTHWEWWVGEYALRLYRADSAKIVSIDDEAWQPGLQPTSAPIPWRTGYSTGISSEEAEKLWAGAIKSLVERENSLLKALEKHRLGKKDSTGGALP